MLTQSGNIGRHYRSRFAVVPEVGVEAGVPISERLKFQMGYTFLYWSDVVRPGDTIDRTVNRFAVLTDQNFGLGHRPGAAGVRLPGHGLLGAAGAQLRFGVPLLSKPDATLDDLADTAEGLVAAVTPQAFDNRFGPALQTHPGRPPPSVGAPRAVLDLSPVNSSTLSTTLGRACGPP